MDLVRIGHDVVPLHPLPSIGQQRSDHLLGEPVPGWQGHGVEEFRQTLDTKTGSAQVVRRIA